MKLPLALLVMTIFGTVVCPAASAQDPASRTFTGTNGPGTGSATFTTDEFVVTAYGGQNEFAIEVKTRDDPCNRPYYFTGTVSFQPNQTNGSIGGPMFRCTNKELKDACAKVGVRLTDYYEVGYTGTIERSNDHSAYLIKITYPYVIWVKEDCKEKRESQASETILLYYQPAAPPPPTLRQQYDRAWDKSTDTVYKSVRGGEWLKNQ